MVKTLQVTPASARLFEIEKQQQEGTLGGVPVGTATMRTTTVV